MILREPGHERVLTSLSAADWVGRHQAALNFGDCLTYAIAKVAGMPLLFTGDDFARTDLLAA